MRTGLLAILLPLALSAGCMYQARVNQQLLQRELRLEEDCIYRLKWQLEDSQRELEEAKLQLGTLQKQSDVLRERGTGSGPDLSAPLGGTGGRGSNAPRLPPAPNLPSVDPGIEAPPSNPAPPARSPRSSAITPKVDGLVSQAGAIEGDKSTLRPAERMNPDVNVDHIVLNPGLNGGIDAEGQPGNDQLSVVIEQRGANDTRVLAPGDVSIVVIDPALPGRQSRIARWNFDADEVKQHVRRNRDGGSLHFELPWPAPPQHSDLRLYVRFITYDGRRLEANLPIEVQLSDDGPGKWRKSKATLADNEDDQSTNRRSVYQRDASDEHSDTAEKTDRSNQRGSPGWSPYR